MKSMVYETDIDSEDLVARIVSAAPEVRETSNIFERVRQSMARRGTVCLDVNGRVFQHYKVVISKFIASPIRRKHIGPAMDLTITTL